MNRAIVVLGAATLAFGSASAYLYNDLRETRAETAALQVRIAELQKPATAAAPAAATQPPALSANPFSPPMSETAVAAPVTTTTQPAATFTAVGAAMIGGGPPMAMMRTGGWEMRNRLLENPEYRDAMKRQQKLMLPRMYPDLRSALQLDEQKADQLYEVLAEQQLNQMTASRPLFTPGSQPDPDAVRDWQAQQQHLRKDSEAAIASVLGDDGLQQWKNYQNSMPARIQVRELRETLESSGIPLQQDQAEQLVTAFAAEQKRTIAEAQAAYAANRLISTNGSGQMGSADRAAQILERQKQQQQNVRDAAAPILTSQQMRQLERMHASQIEMMEVSLKLNQAQQAEAAARGDLRSAPMILPTGGIISER